MSNKSAVSTGNAVEFRPFIWLNFYSYVNPPRRSLVADFSALPQ